jgi:EAL domain-containing protein (putative c-di-GMP-specific phosphodiesterase class I)
LSRRNKFLNYPSDTSVIYIQTIAEFVETVEAKEMLQKLGVNFAQGYVIHKPQPVLEIIAQAEAGADSDK